MANRAHMKVRLKGIGPGGWYCHCCSPSKKRRPAWCRMAKRSERQAAARDVQRDMAPA